MNMTKINENKKTMTIKDLPILDSLKVHFISQSPLDNDFIVAVQGTDYCTEARKVRVDSWTFKENRLALLMKHNKGAFLAFSKEAEKKYDQATLQNASRYLNIILGKNNIPTGGLHVSVISWFIFQMIDVEATLKLNKWELS